MTSVESFVCATCAEEFSLAGHAWGLLEVQRCPCCGGDEVEPLGEGASELPPDQARAA